MAITLNLYYSSVVNAIRAEEGNLRYEYFSPMEDEETILLIDSWTDQQAIDVHHASPRDGENYGAER